MSEKNDGGAAFPTPVNIPAGHYYQGPGGMTLRDYFAGQFVAGRRMPIEDYEDAARNAYELADAMLTEREK